MSVSMLRTLAAAGSAGRSPRVLARSYHASNALDNMFDKILVANRGEIACRIIKSARKMGIKTVAVYSEPDMFAKHVTMADEAVNIGPAASKESYLRVDKIIDAVRQTGAQAVHPGYGFLSENQAFVAELEKAGVTFIGPPSKAIYAMGDKIESKKIAKAAGVNVIPGFLGEIPTVEDAVRIANEVGYPIMLKASAGGGGKGMRIAWNDAEAVEGFRLAKQEAANAFGDDRLLIERYIDNPRHIEIQVLCDQHGRNLYLNERECSLQRRNQKVIEEAPSPFLTPEVRKAMGEQATALCARVGYVSAGTVEFLVDSQRNFYFLEMNTRLQVEHPITEMITGIDIVEWMIRIAAGERLSIAQSDVGIKGWAMESRVYAEDPLRSFLPQIGRLVRYKEPDLLDGKVRCDSGILEGSEISMYYDPLISKLVTHGETRDEALALMRDALDTYVIRGLTHNVNFLRAVLDNARFMSGNITTKFIPEEYPKGFKGIVLNAEQQTQLSVLAAGLHHLRRLRTESISPAGPSAFGEYVVREGKGAEQRNVRVLVETDTVTSFNVYVGEHEAPLSLDFSEYAIDTPVVHAYIDGKAVTIQLLAVTDLGFRLQFIGTDFAVDVMDVMEAELFSYMKEPVIPDTSNFVLSPMAGTLVSVSVKPGDSVHLGAEVAVVEAMKMQNVLRAPREGKVKAVKAQAGSSLSLDQIIIEFEPPAKEVDPGTA